MNVLCVDLDGTLVHTDTLHEEILLFIKQKPLRSYRLLLWLLHGKAYFKQQLANEVLLAINNLPYNAELIAFIKNEKAHGRKIAPVTAADKKIADSVATHLNLFDEVIASDGQTNLKASQKALVLAQRYGKKNYDYIGNAKADLPVWQNARQALFVNKSTCLVKNIQRITPLQHHFRLKRLSLEVLSKPTN